MHKTWESTNNLMSYFGLNNKIIVCSHRYQPVNRYASDWTGGKRGYITIISFASSRTSGVEDALLNVLQFRACVKNLKLWVLISSADHINLRSLINRQNSST